MKRASLHRPSGEINKTCNVRVTNVLQSLRKSPKGGTRGYRDAPPRHEHHRKPLCGLRGAALWHSLSGPSRGLNFAEPSPQQQTHDRFMRTFRNPPLSPIRTILLASPHPTSAAAPSAPLCSSCATPATPATPTILLLLLPLLLLLLLCYSCYSCYSCYALYMPSPPSGAVPPLHVSLSPYSFTTHPYLCRNQLYPPIRPRKMTPTRPSTTGKAIPEVLLHARPPQRRLCLRRDRSAATGARAARSRSNTVPPLLD